MNKKLLTTLTIATLLFTACGSDSKSSSESVESKIKKKDYILIVDNAALENCNVSVLKEKISGTLFGELEFAFSLNKDSLVTSYEDKIVNCEKYNRIDEGSGNCLSIETDGTIGFSCVIAFDFQK